MRSQSRMAAAVALGICSFLAASGIAGAVGGGYGPSGAVPSGVPGGFTSVLMARSLASGGGTVHAAFDGCSVTASVPGGALPGGGQVAFTRAKDGALKQGLKGKLNRDNVAFAMGFVLDHNGRALNSTRPIAITITCSSLKVGDVIVAYRGGKFVKIGVVTVAGEAAIEVRGVTELAILST